MASRFGDVLTSIGLMLQLLFERAAAVAQRTAEELKRLWRIFMWFVGLSVLVPAVLFVLGAVLHQSILFTIAGMLLALSLGLILLAFVPLAALIGAVHKKSRETSRRYLSAVAGVVFWELLFTLYCSILPVWENPRAVFTAALCFFILCFAAAAWGHRYLTWFRKAAVFLVAVVFIFATLSLIFPSIPNALHSALTNVDKRIAGGGITTTQEPPGGGEELPIEPRGSGEQGGRGQPPPVRVRQPGPEEPAVPTYVRSSLPQKTGRTTLIVAIGSDARSGAAADAGCISLVSKSLEASGYAAVADAFTEAFYQDGLYSRLVRRDGSVLAGAGLGRFADYVLAGTTSLTSGSVTTRPLGDILELSASLAYAVFDPNGSVVLSGTLSADGSGRDRSSAESSALDGVVAQVPGELARLPRH